MPSLENFIYVSTFLIDIPIDLNQKTFLFAFAVLILFSHCTYAVVCAAASRGLRVRRLRSVLQTKRSVRAERFANRFAFVNRVVNSVYNWVLIKREWIHFSGRTAQQPDDACVLAVSFFSSCWTSRKIGCFIINSADRPKSQDVVWFCGN